MNYGVKYQITVQSRKWKNTVRIEIQKRGYSSTIYKKSLGAGGIILEKANAGIINGTNLSFNIQCDKNFEYVEFFTSVPRTFRVVMYVNDVAFWTGFIIPEEHSEPLINPPYDVFVKAVDGLGLLKNYDYPANTDNYSVFARSYVLWKILALTGLELDLAIAYDVQLGDIEQNEWFFDYINIDENCLLGKTAYDALCQIIPPDATITQSKNKWLIRRNEQDHYKDHRILTFGTASYIHNRFESGETVLQLAAMGDGDIYPIGMAIMGMQFAWKKLTLNENRGLRESFLKNHKFAEDLKYWSIEGTGNFASTRIVNEQSILVLSGARTLDDFVFQEVNIENEGDIILVLKIGARGYQTKRKLFGKTVGYYPCNTWIRIMLKITDELGQNTYFLDKTAGWTDEYTRIEHEITANPANVELQEIQVIASAPPISGKMTLILFRGMDLSDYIIETYFTDIVLKTSIANEYTSQVKNEVYLVPHGAESGEFDLFPCDVPNIVNAMNIFTSGQYDYDKPILKYLNNKTEVNTYLGILTSSLVYLHGVIRQILDGTFRGQSFHLNTVIQCPVCSDRKYILVSGVHDLYNDKISCQFLEIPGTASDTAWILKDGIWEDTGIWIDNEEWYDEDPN